MRLISKRYGKGICNLRTEHIIKPKYFNVIASLKKYNDILTMPQNIYTLISSQYGITDYYALKAKNTNMEIKSFLNFAKS